MVPVLRIADTKDLQVVPGHCVLIQDLEGLCDVHIASLDKVPLQSRKLSALSGALFLFGTGKPTRIRVDPFVF
jgi:hypothetical protein